MNKIVLGSTLVAVMGGVPGATYLLTREGKTTNSIAQPESGDTARVDEQVSSGNPGSNTASTSGRGGEDSVTSGAGGSGPRG